MITVKHEVQRVGNGATPWDDAELLRPLETEYFDSVHAAYEEMVTLLLQQPLGVIGLDTKGYIGFCNPSALRVLGMCSNPVGQYWGDVLPFSEWFKAEVRSLVRRPYLGPCRLCTRIDTVGRGARWVELELRTVEHPSSHILLFLDDINLSKAFRPATAKERQVPGFVGTSDAMQATYKQIEAVAGADCTVLVEGETGTGKELAARAVHSLSARADKPFLAVNCAGLSDTLWASQLFGHTRGAFTGATRDCPGLFESAGGGTLFLDEVGDMPMTVQMSLLRVLQEREVVRLGEIIPRKVSARIVVATNRDLRQAVQDRTFREDLFYRIRVARIQMPPLRTRIDDCRRLIPHFLGRSVVAKAKGIVGVDAQVMNRFEAHPWPGNVRELENVLECCAIQCEGRVISMKDLPPEFLVPEVIAIEVDQGAPSDNERITEALRRAGGRRAEAARLLGMSRATLYRRLKELNSVQTPRTA